MYCQNKCQKHKFYCCLLEAVGVYFWRDLNINCEYLLEIVFLCAFLLRDSFTIWIVEEIINSCHQLHFSLCSSLIQECVKSSLKPCFRSCISYCDFYVCMTCSQQNHSTLDNLGAGTAIPIY